MRLHKVKAHNFEELNFIPNIHTHILVTLAEINANCSLFGGIESDSFKIKYKNYCRFIGRYLNNKEQVYFTKPKDALTVDEDIFFKTNLSTKF